MGSRWMAVDEDTREGGVTPARRDSRGGEPQTESLAVGRRMG